MNGLYVVLVGRDVPAITVLASAGALALKNTVPAGPGTLPAHGPRSVDEAQYLRVDVDHLRRKIEEDPSRPKRLLTELGVGYRLVAS